MLAVSLSAAVAPRAICVPVFAQDAWPSRPVEVICPFSAGGPTDVFIRIFCAFASERTGQNFLVKNILGASGTIGTAALAKAAPDGYTIGLYNAVTHASSTMIIPDGVDVAAPAPYDSVKDFEAIGTLYLQSNVLLTRRDLPVSSVEELVSLAKVNPKPYTAAHGGIATTPHISLVLFEQMTGITFTSVGYKGGTGEAVRDIVGGHADLMFDNIGPAVTNIRAGTMKGLAVTSRKRNRQLPELPALDELLPGYEMTTWGGLCGPRGLPQAVVDKLSVLIKEALEGEVGRKYTQMGAEPVFMNPVETLAFRNSDAKRIHDSLVKAGFKVRPE